MSSRNYGLVLFAITAIALVGWSPWSSSQSKGPYSPDWPPPPWALFNFHGKNLELSGGDTTVGPNEKQVIYTVPESSWLIVTHAGNFVGNADPFLVERLGSVETIKATLRNHQTPNGLFGDLGSGGPVGFAFQPGSEVVIWNSSSNNYSASLIQWSLVGYLVRP